MPIPLFQALRDEARAIADELFRGLRTARTPHYRGAAEELLRQRCRELVEAFVKSCDREPDAFSTHVRAVTCARIAKGYSLVEMQRALSLLEAAAWRVVVDRSNVLNVVRHLSVVTSVIGGAKDQLATAFLEEAIRRGSALQGLEGTDAHIEADEDGEPVLARR